MNKTPGVYAITNTINGKIYIGSAVNLDRRCKQHKNALLKHIHHNSHLQAAWDKYGEDAFTFTVVTECSRELCGTIEQITITLYNSVNTGYNIQSNVTLNPDDICKARALSTTPRPPCSEETKEKISQANKGNQVWVGKHHTAETKAKIGATNKEKQLGRHHSEETKAKMAEARKKFWSDPEKVEQQNLIKSGLKQFQKLEEEQSI